MCAVRGGCVCEIPLRLDALLDEGKKLWPTSCLVEASLPKGDDETRRSLLRVSGDVLASDCRDDRTCLP
jgi:hypothetical protein